MKIDKKAWHYLVFKEFGDRIYGNTLNDGNFYDDGKIHHAEVIFEINEDGVVLDKYLEKGEEFFVKLVKGNEYFLLPKKYIKDLPLDSKNAINVKIKRGDTVVWKLITSVESLSIPAKKTMSPLEFIIRWNPLKHENKETWLFMKLVAMCQGIKLGICAETGSGKNSNQTILHSLRKDFGNKQVESTKAIFYATMYYNEYIVIDEITSWEKSKILIEELISTVADDSPNMSKYAKDSNRNMENMSVDNKSVIFTFNPLSENNKRPFKQCWRNADKVLDRYPIFKVDGKIIDSFVKPNKKEINELLLNNDADIKTMVENEHYYRLNISEHTHGWDRTQLVLKRRHLSNTARLIDWYDAISNSQEEFDVHIEFLNKSYNKFKELSSDNTDIEVEEVMIEDDL